MPVQLKEIYSESFFHEFSEVADSIIPGFNKERFIELIFVGDRPLKGLKERMKHTSFVLNSFLPDDFNEAALHIEKIVKYLISHGKVESSIEYMFLPDYIEKYGINHFEISVKLFEYITQFTSCEFAVRPFIIKYGDKMMQQMLQWSLHDNHHVRRLASEGSRPILPWAISLPELRKNPNPILPILENLKADSSEYVRRSVANNLNDIAKDHPNIVISIAKQWKGCGKQTEAIMKHGCRTLLKHGNSDILKYYQLNGSNNIQVIDFKIITPAIKIGCDLKFSFILKNTEEKAQTARVEFAIYYLRQNGKYSKKVFKISERQVKPNKQLTFVKKKSFKIITTRKFYVGKQKISIIINGTEKEVKEFELNDL